MVIDSIAKNTYANVAPSNAAPNNPDPMFATIRLIFLFAVSFIINDDGLLIKNGLKIKTNELSMLNNFLNIIIIKQKTSIR